LLVRGLAYKKNVDHCCESLSIKILKLLADRGVTLSYFDPHVSGYVLHRYGRLPGGRIVQLSASVIDTRNATRNVATNRDKIILA
jgi:UDP-N-acetyl-D-glucosamine dehydrogenase